MNLTKKLTPMVVAGSLATSALLAVPAVQAETSASIAVANMYLWRGQNLTPNGGQVSGSLDYSHESGAYAGVWTTTETGGHETDLYLGFGGEASGVSYDVSYWRYLYPEDVNDAGGDSLSDTDAADVVVSLGYGPVTFAAYVGVDSDLDDDTYYTLTGEMGKFSLTYGWWSLENPIDNPAPGDGGDEYSHVQIGYAATDELSFAISKASSDNGETEEDPLFLVSWGKSFDLK